jgi:hypothetical protein
LLYLPPKLVCLHQNFLHRVYTNLNSSFLEWRLGCKTCIVYTGLKWQWFQAIISPLNKRKILYCLYKQCFFSFLLLPPIKFIPQ